MSVIPKQDERLDLFQGSTFDETWGFTDEDDAPLWTGAPDAGWTGDLTVRKDYDSDVTLHLTKIASIGSPPDTSGLVFLSDGQVRVYVTDEDMAALSPAGFAAVKEDRQPVLRGRWDIELQNPEGERVRWVEGPAYLSREVSYA